MDIAVSFLFRKQVTLLHSQQNFLTRHNVDACRVVFVETALLLYEESVHQEADLDVEETIARDLVFCAL